jgi:hypothetical protein
MPAVPLLPRTTYLAPCSVQLRISWQTTFLRLSNSIAQVEAIPCGVSDCPATIFVLPPHHARRITALTLLFFLWSFPSPVPLHCPFVSFHTPIAPSLSLTSHLLPHGVYTLCQRHPDLTFAHTTALSSFIINTALFIAGRVSELLHSPTRWYLSLSDLGTSVSPTGVLYLPLHFGA